MQSAKFAKYVFRIAGIYGLIVLAPQYFMEERVGRDYPPPLTHPEFFYGFIGIALAFQVLFITISTDPVRFRPAMIAGILEKLSFGIPAVVLYVTGRLNPVTLGFGVFDLVLAALFLWAFVSLAPVKASGQ
ncbi:MAG: hypothetical protein L0Z53_10925 [Acidobacteriales bacterium]|nr:hypothetical protein [Terriglobales bacterium]